MSAIPSEDDTLRRLRADTAKLLAEADKLNAEKAKLLAEESKLLAERRWYPMVLMAAAFASGAAVLGACLAMAKLILA